MGGDPNHLLTGMILQVHPWHNEIIFSVCVWPDVPGKARSLHGILSGYLLWPSSTHLNLLFLAYTGSLRMVGGCRVCSFLSSTSLGMNLTSSREDDGRMVSTYIVFLKGRVFPRRPSSLLHDSMLSRWWFQIFFMFIPIWGKISNLTHIFQMGLVQPPTSYASRFFLHEIELKGGHWNKQLKRVSRVFQGHMWLWWAAWNSRSPQQTLRHASCSSTSMRMRRIWV